MFKEFKEELFDIGFNLEIDDETRCKLKVDIFGFSSYMSVYFYDDRYWFTEHYNDFLPTIVEDDFDTFKEKVINFLKNPDTFIQEAKDKALEDLVFFSEKLHRAFGYSLLVEMLDKVEKIPSHEKKIIMRLWDFQIKGGE